MEETLQSSLQEGESILWRGKAEAFETLDKTHKNHFIKNTVISSIIAIVCAIFLFSTGGFETKSFVLTLIIAVLCMIPSINVLQDASKLRKMEYIATTDRLIVLRDAVRSAYYSQIHEGAFLEDEDGHISLACGKDALKAKPYKRREICVVGAGTSESGNEIERFCFYAPTDRDALTKILHEKMPAIF